MEFVTLFSTSIYKLDVKLFIFQLRLSNLKWNFLFSNLEFVTRKW